LVIGLVTAALADASESARDGGVSLKHLIEPWPGVEVARVDSNVWAVGIREFGSAFSKSVLVLIDVIKRYLPRTPKIPVERSQLRVPLQGKQPGTSVYSMSSCLWGKWLFQLSKTTE
jgi:hypothetical protein